ncbi:HNH endonuclease signature motif containing protein [Cellulomonas alba]|uniref:DUF222 domain-containing protein n=1 Tax=Cellulomonas alba TaxID=3053467 RepID=A0ABT7SAU7_9CELL|nr:HNH endonuclease signature motif containing protein [Cellulomonas alba]MDM7853314.1 DUF222 domain-containing protein [Cellulomonas alba]
MYESAPRDPCGVVRRALDAVSLSDDELVRILTEVESLARFVDAAGVRLAAEVAHRSRRELGGERLSARRGCRNGAELVQRATGVSGASAGRRIRLGLATRADVGLAGGEIPARFPAVAESLAAGDLGVEAAQAIVTTLEPTLGVADPSHAAAAEADLVAAATETWTDEPEHRADGAIGGAAPPVIDADTVRVQAKVWAEYLDPDGSAPDERDEERRFMALHRPRRGLVPVTGLLLPQVAAMLRTYADAWTSPRTEPVPDPTRAPGDCVPDDAADGDGAPAETRSRAQVMHDVLATALNVAARVVDAPSVAGNAPTLVVVARESDLVSGEGAAQTDDGTALSITAARHVGCAGAVQRVGIDAAGRIVGLWSSERCFTGAQRRAIALRDGGCVIPGCHVSAAWCEVHHVVPHADDPDGTTTDNGTLLCWHHHRTLETSGWAIRMVDGLPWIKAPGWLDRAGRWRPSRPGGPTAAGQSRVRRQR